MLLSACELEISGVDLPAGKTYMAAVKRDSLRILSGTFPSSAFPGKFSAWSRKLSYHVLGKKNKHFKERLTASPRLREDAGGKTTRTEDAWLFPRDGDRVSVHSL